MHFPAVTEFVTRVLRRASFGVPFFLCFAIALSYSIFAERQYSTTAVLIPVGADRSAGALAQLASRFGGLGSFVPGGFQLQAGDQQRNLQILKSRKVAEQFILEADLLPHLFEERWDSEAKKWLPKEGAVFGLLPADRPDDPPSLWYAFKRLKDKRSIVSDELSNTVRVTHSFDDPELSRSVTEQYVRFVNNFIRELDKEAVTQNLDFVTKQLSVTNVPAVKEALGRVAQDQLEKRMLLEVRDQYAYEVVDPPVAPEEPTRPRIILALALGLSGGALLGVLLTLVTETYREATKK